MHMKNAFYLTGRALTLEQEGIEEATLADPRKITTAAVMNTKGVLAFSQMEVARGTTTETISGATLGMVLISLRNAEALPRREGRIFLTEDLGRSHTQEDGLWNTATVHHHHHHHPMHETRACTRRPDRYQKAEQTRLCKPSSTWKGGRTETTSGGRRLPSLPQESALLHAVTRPAPPTAARAPASAAEASLPIGPKASCSLHSKKKSQVSREKAPRTARRQTRRRTIRLKGKKRSRPWLPSQRRVRRRPQTNFNSDDRWQSQLKSRRLKSRGLSCFLPPAATDRQMPTPWRGEKKILAQLPCLIEKRGFHRKHWRSPPPPTFRYDSIMSLQH
ncbi:periphilin-1 isoform X6 [Nerophis ophidion]|uniref:periphilin-1 isoform X6 n=1 Tax=Nerophis ophidion TaxID=159077 RepID=UPI002ADFB4ED|nr:periphilin-1 isoform X6 [Nerophis ophidion]